MQREDYIERMIRQVAEAVAHALGVARGGDVARAQDEIRQTWVSAVGLRWEDAKRLDASTLRALLGAKRELALKLLEAQAELGDRDAARLLAELRS